MIVNKPQFDMEVINKGDVYWLRTRDYRKFIVYTGGCIVKSVEPFKVIVTYYDDENRSFKDFIVPIEDVVSKTITLDKMVVKEDNE